MLAAKQAVSNRPITDDDAAPQSGLNVVITDDEKDFVGPFTEQVKDIANELFFQVNVEMTYSGEECLIASKRRKVDLIFLDYRMPEMDGVEVFQRLRSNQETKNTHICFISGETSLETKIDDHRSTYFVDKANIDNNLRKIIEKVAKMIGVNQDIDPSPTKYIAFFPDLENYERAVKFLEEDHAFISSKDEEDYIIHFSVKTNVQNVNQTKTLIERLETQLGGEVVENQVEKHRSAEKVIDREVQLFPQNTSYQEKENRLRYAVFLSDADNYKKAIAFIENTPLDIVLTHAESNLITISLPKDESKLEEAKNTLEVLKSRFDVEIVEDPFLVGFSDGNPDRSSNRAQNTSLMEDVLKKIKAEEAWHYNYKSSRELIQGQGIIIAIVDGGVDGELPEFGGEKKLQIDAIEADIPCEDKNDPWIDSDERRHGTSVALIATGTNEHGGTFVGVAPKAKIFSCKAESEADLIKAYSCLANLAKTENNPIIVVQSTGLKTQMPPRNSLISEKVWKKMQEGINRGIKIIFAAGNNHEGYPSEDCTPNTIWLYSSYADVMTVAACDLEGTKQQIAAYSSRGPGQFFNREAAVNQKPDITAPVPEHWGTSGAAPQVAGLVALLLSVNSSLTTTEIFNIIRDTATQLDGYCWNCQGAGVINCFKAVKMAKAMRDL
jgi:subtilisin family serine protease